MAGAVPHSTTAAAPAANSTATTGQLRPIGVQSDNASEGIPALNPRSATHVTNAPPAHAAAHSTDVSASNWRTIRPLVAPSERRVAISPDRRTPRESRRLPTFDEAISTTSAPAIIKAAHAGL